jgi:hypothetical protein
VLPGPRVGQIVVLGAVGVVPRLDALGERALGVRANRFRFCSDCGRGREEKG